MKDYLLQKLFKKLQEMGIESSFSDFNVEHIDLRDFPINENYNLVQCENLSSINEAKSTLDDIIALVNIIKPYFYIFSRFHNNKEIKKIFPGSTLQLDLRVKAQAKWRNNQIVLDKIFRTL